MQTRKRRNKKVTVTKNATTESGFLLFFEHIFICPEIADLYP